MGIQLRARGKGCPRVGLTDALAELPREVCRRGCMRSDPRVGELCERPGEEPARAHLLGDGSREDGPRAHGTHACQECARDAKMARVLQLQSIVEWGDKDGFGLLRRRMDTDCTRTQGKISLSRSTRGERFGGCHSFTTYGRKTSHGLPSLFYVSYN